MSQSTSPAARRVLDTSALMSGRSFEGELFTTEAVLGELRRLDALTPQLDAFLAVKVQVISPSRQSVETVRAKSETTGDAHRLSLTDMGLLAATSELEAVVVTDDYSIQNLAAEMGLAYETIEEPGIQRVVRWRYRCSGCGKMFEEWRDPCPVCGAKVRTTRTA